MKQIITMVLLGIVLTAGLAAAGQTAGSAGDAGAGADTAQAAFREIKAKVAAINAHARRVYEQFHTLNGQIEEKDREIKDCESRLQVYLKKMKADEGLEEADFQAATRLQTQGQSAVSQHRALVEAYNALKAEGRALQGIREAVGAAVEANDMAGIQSAIAAYENRFGTL